jgi:hypothetical protein
VDRPDDRAAHATTASGCSVDGLHAQTSYGGEGSEIRYRCQATQLYDFSEPLAVWDARQYLFDVVTGNRTASRVARVLFLSWLRWILHRLPFGYRLFKALIDVPHRALTGRPVPMIANHLADGERTPTGRLGLQPGEYVRIKTQREIGPTINSAGRNRGLGFDADEMAPYCGRVVRVRKAVQKIIEEPTGKMIEMKHPCIMLEGVVCNAESATWRLNCPRAIPSYWRELWLERVDPKNTPRAGS